MQRFFSHRFIQRATVWVKAHRWWSAFILVAVILVGYWAFHKSAATETRFVLGRVSRGTLVVSFSGSGQVAATTQLDLKPKVSGDVVWVGAKAGAKAAAGAALVSLDSTTAARTLADAELDLAEAKLQADKSAAQAPIEYERKKESLANAGRDLEKAYEDAFNSVASAYLELPGIMTGGNEILYGKALGANAGSGQFNVNIYRDFFVDADGVVVNAAADRAERDFGAARSLYDAGFAAFKIQPRTTDPATTKALLTETLAIARAVAQAVKAEVNLLDTVVGLLQDKNRPVSSVISGFQSQSRGFLGTVDARVSLLFGADQTVENSGQAVTNLKRDIALLLVNNPTGAAPIDLQIAKNSVLKKEASVKQMRSDLREYTVRAPFAGTIAKVDAKIRDSVSSGTALLSFISDEKIAEVSLNEIDVAAIALGQKATLTFDALPGLSLPGVVREIDTVGTLTQGVVTYIVKLGFESDDSRVKPGMSVTAAIVTAVRPDVLLVPNSAVKSRRGASYLETIPEAADSTTLARSAFSAGISSKAVPTQVPIEVGLSNDSATEVLSGVEEGNVVVIRTVAVAAAPAQTQAPSIFGAVRGGGGGGGARALGR